MANTRSISSFFYYILLLLIHLGCFFIIAKSHTTKNKSRKITPISTSSSHDHKPLKSFSSSLSYVRSFFSLSSNCCKSITAVDPSRPSSSSISTATSRTDPSPRIAASPNQIHPRTTKNDISSSDNYLFPLRNDIFPCPTCGEIFNSPSLLDGHKSVKHAVTELIEGDTGNNIVRIIFNTGWTCANKKNPTPVIKRILKIHNSPKILFRFEEYRELVKGKAVRSGEFYNKRDERCIADGNELLRFHCTTFLCELGRHGGNLCNGQYCSVCRIVRRGFSQKIDGISTFSSTWKAHESIPGEIEEEFRFMNVKRAMLVCRVIAGRVGSEQYEPSKMDCGYDSIVGSGGSGIHIRDDEDELLVFNPRAVLPCFVIVYNTL